MDETTKQRVRSICCQPSAALRLVEVQPPLLPGGSTVETFTTSQGKLFDKVTDAKGIITWYRVLGT